jgi:lipopolysaccharide transport system ATP-binding protein
MVEKPNQVRELPHRTVLQVRQLGKRYRVGQSPADRLRTVLGWPGPSNEYWALQGLNFELQEGQCLGVIGDNGAGKSTLLKLLAGTLRPSEGSVACDGRVTAILELGAGFHPDFTGRENLFFGGRFIGLSEAELQHAAPDVLAFSELGEAIDRPVKTYSSGMVVRLAFAMVTAVQPQVLIVDEALAVGDQHFQKKCLDRIETFRAQGCTILFCSHSLYHVRQLCDQVLWLDQGRVKALGGMDEVITAYETHVRLQGANLPSADEVTGQTVLQPLTQEDHKTNARAAAITQAWVDGLQGKARPILQTPDVRITLQAVTDDETPPSMGFMLEQYKGVGIMSMATHAEGVKPVSIGRRLGKTEWSITLTLTDLPLHSGTYVLSFYLFDALGLVVCDEWKDHIVFEWVSHSLTPGLVRLPHVWS